MDFFRSSLSLRSFKAWLKVHVGDTGRLVPDMYYCVFVGGQYKAIWFISGSLMENHHSGLIQVHDEG